MPMTDPKHLGGFNPEPGCDACQADAKTERPGLAPFDSEKRKTAFEMIGKDPDLRGISELVDIINSHAMAGTTSSGRNEYGSSVYETVLGTFTKKGAAVRLGELLSNPDIKAKVTEWESYGQEAPIGGLFFAWPLEPGSVEKALQEYEKRRTAQPE